MRKFRTSFLVPIYLEVEISDEEIEETKKKIKELREGILKDLYKEECSDEEINADLNTYLYDIILKKFYNAKKQYEIENKKNLVDPREWIIEEI